MHALNGGGAEKVLIEILRHINYKQYNVELLLNYTDGIHFKEVPSNVKIISIYGDYTIKYRILDKLSSVSRWINCFRQFYLKKKLFSILDEKYDSIISFMEGDALKNHSYITNKSHNNITWLHTDLPKNHWTLLRTFHNSKEEKSCYEKMNKIVFVSNEIKNTFQDLYKLNRKGIVIYNPINTEEIIKKADLSEIKKECFTIISIGRLTQIKRYDRLIKAIQLLKAENYKIKVWILGEGEEEKSLKELSTKLKVDDTIYFKGYKENPYPYIKAADLLVSTSDAESFSLVIAEALCLGKIIISTKTAGALELLENKYGILVEMNEQSLYIALKKILDNKKLQEKYKSLSLERARNLSDIKSTMEQLYSLFN